MESNQQSPQPGFDSSMDCCTAILHCFERVLFYLFCCCCGCCGCPCCCWGDSSKAERSYIPPTHGSYGSVSTREPIMTGYGHGSSTNQERPVTTRAAPSQVAVRHTNEMPKQNKKFTSPFNPAPKTRINIKAGKGATIIAGEDTLQNAQIDVESRTRQNNIVGLGQNGNYTVTTADGRLQKQAGGEFVHTPGTALTEGTSGYKEIEN